MAACGAMLRFKSFGGETAPFLFMEHLQKLDVNRGHEPGASSPALRAASPPLRAVERDGEVHGEGTPSKIRRESRP